MKEESDDNKEAKAFDFEIESQMNEVKLEKKGCKKREESDKSVRKGKEKGAKETGGFMRTEEENLTEVPEENRKKSRSNNTGKIKAVTHQEGQNITKKLPKQITQ